jgi:hypothetical protein
MAKLRNVTVNLQRPDVPTTFDFKSHVKAGSNFWIEQIADVAPGSDECSPKYAHSSLYAFVPNDARAMYNFENTVLGFHYTTGDGNGGYRIVRNNPIRHPRKDNLVAAKISEMRGRKFGRTVGADMTGRQQDFFDNESKDLVRYNKGLTEFAIYDHNLVCVEFSPPKYTMYSDEAIKHLNIRGRSSYYEWERYLEYDVKPNIYDVTIQTGSYAYAEGEAGNPGPSAGSPPVTKGKTFPGELNYYEVKTTFNVHWRNVPEDYVLDTTNYQLGYPTNLVRCAGKVNKYEFLGYPAGTLLLLEPEIDRYVSGTLKRKIRNRDVNATDLKDGENLPFYMCDVTLPIIHFDPPSYSRTNRGHNLKPWRKESNSDAFWFTNLQNELNAAIAAGLGGPEAPDNSTMIYYLVKFTKSDGTPTEIKIYGEEDFTKLFEHWSVI